MFIDVENAFLVSGDNGYSGMKFCDGIGCRVFDSKIQKANSMSGNVIELNGEAYQVASGSDDLSMDKTKSLVHRLCLLRALAECKADNFNVVLDLPIAQYFDENYRKKFKEYMGKSETIIYNGQKKDIRINEMSVYPQGLAALFANNGVNKYEDKLIGVMDIGGMTVDCCVVDKTRPIEASIFSINLGSNYYLTKIKDKLYSKLRLNIQTYEIPYYISDGIPGEPNSKELIDEALHEYFDLIKREMDIRNWSTETINMVGIGGGVIYIKDYLELYFNNYDQVEDPIFANAMGCYELGAMAK